MSPLLLGLLLVPGAATAHAGAGSEEEALRAREAQRLLSDRCFACHGPDAAARRAELRLDTREGMYEDRGGYAAVVPGDAPASELVSRITSSLAGEQMPPPDSGLALSGAEVELLRGWIEDGADFLEHWSFEPPVRTAPPPVEGAEWVRDELDGYVLARLEEDGLGPAPEASPGELVRRLFLDLTGLPPDPEDVSAFEEDPSDRAYSRLVDRLLASPRYGERMAWEWLEAARYADTDGYQADPTRQMWPWRDWLVRALNENVPFDRLTVELLAGDLLPDATPEEILASAFNRNHAYNGEGGRIAEETRVENVFDRVETTGTVWLGLTFECARCHDHKFDPVSQREYYALYDFFNQTSESGAGGSGRAAPVLSYLEPGTREELARLEEELAEIDERRTAPDADLDREQLLWEAGVLDVLAAEPGHGLPTDLSPWRVSEVFAPPEGNASLSFDHAHPPELGVEPEWRLAEELVDGQTHELPQDLGSTYLVRDLEVPTPRTLVLSLGSDDAIRVWLDGEEVLSRNVARGVQADQERVELAVEAGAHELLLKIVNTGGRAGVYFRVAEERALGLDANLVGALGRAGDTRSDEEREALRVAFRTLHAPWWEETEQRARELEAERARLQSTGASVMVMDHLPAERRRKTRVLERGGYDQPRSEVTADVPAFLPGLPAGVTPDRLALAYWLVSPENPLTARVAVNRAWQTLFGRGLVSTPEDFGRQGETASHPELLDTLARDFVEGGWDTKALHRRLVMSSTYRQSAARETGAFREDPDNVLIGRSARHRLPAWMLRDQALALAGLLVDDRGGPPVRPYQPEGVWAEATFGQIRYSPDSGESLYRRSLYVFWRRIVGPTIFFDGARRQTCEVRPGRTNTPLHALVTLNETAYVEAARVFAERVHRSADGDRARVSWAFRAATARTPEPHELELLVGRLTLAREHFEAHPEEASALLGVGEALPDPKIEPAELAAHAVVCGVILNLDEVLTRP